MTKSSTQEIYYGQRRITFRLVFPPQSKLVRKVRIHVHADGKIEVEAPKSAPVPEIRKAVSKRGKWLAKNLEQIENRLMHVSKREYVSGETHFYLGRRYQLKVRKISQASNSVETVKLLGSRIEICTFDRSSDHVKRLLKNWYQERAMDLFPQYLATVVQQIPWLNKMPKLKLRSMQKRWGSCSATGSVTLNSRLICAPKECIYYVLWHEVCHLKEANHSPKYYKLLSKYLPDSARLKMKLDDMAELLLNE
ncbi:M48 family metallopeptidase [bacterium]|nr:M48 family metallopeptidase [bacterium]